MKNIKYYTQLRRCYETKPIDRKTIYIFDVDTLEIVCTANDIFDGKQYYKLYQTLRNNKVEWVDIFINHKRYYAKIFKTDGTLNRKMFDTDFEEDKNIDLDNGSGND